MTDSRKKFDEEIKDILSDFINQREEKLELKFYVGKIEDNKDPDQLGRCKIRVFGVFDKENIPTEDLPWAVPDFNFIGSTLGSFVVPPEETLVRVYFNNDDIYEPRYTTKVIDRNTIGQLSEREEDYPNSMLFFQTDAGDFFKLNRLSMEMTFRHNSGLQITVNADGDMTIDNTQPDSGKLTINTKGDISLTSEDGDVLIEAPKGAIRLGGASATQPILNIPADPTTGAPMNIGQQFPATPGASYVRP